MEEVYKTFLSLLKKDYPVSDIKSLSDYMVWLKNHGFTIGTLDSYGDGFSFTFDCNSVETIFQDVLTLIKQYSKAGYSTNTEWKHVFNTKCEDIVTETEYQDCAGCSNMTCEWIDDEKKELGVYRVYKHKFKYEDALIVPCDFESSNDFSIFEDKINQMPSWEVFKSYKVVDGNETFEWFEIENYIETQLIRDVFDDLDKILVNFMVLHFADSLLTLEREIGTSYYVLCGYNKSANCGEGWVIPDYIPH